MKKIFLTLLAVSFLASSALADLYQWTDKEGVLHLTNDIGSVPEDYRGKVKVYKSAPAEKKKEAVPEAQPPEQEKGEELYGDQTLDWWKETFRKKTEDLQALEAGYNAKKQFIAVFEGGRRFGQVFSTEDVETYNRYLKELPRDEASLNALKDELSELRRKARILGVPKSVRGE